MKQQQKGECLICDKPSKETQVILHSLRLKLKKQIKQNLEDFEASTKNGQQKSLNRIIAMMFGQAYFTDKSTTQCLHTPLFMSFKRKLRCSTAVLLSLIEESINEIGEKQYHLDILSKQISGAGTRLLKNGFVHKEKISVKQEDNRPIPNPQRQDAEKKSMEGFIKVEEKIENKQERSRENQEQPVQNSFYFIPFFFPQGY